MTDQGIPADAIRIKMTTSDQLWGCWLPYAALDFDRRLNVLNFLAEAEGEYRFIELACVRAGRDKFRQPHTLGGVLYMWRRLRDQHEDIFGDASGLEAFKQVLPELDSHIVQLRDLMLLYPEYAHIDAEDLPPPTGEDFDWKPMALPGGE